MHVKSVYIWEMVFSSINNDFIQELVLPTKTENRNENILASEYQDSTPGLKNPTNESGPQDESINEKQISENNEQVHFRILSMFFSCDLVYILPIRFFYHFSFSNSGITIKDFQPDTGFDRNEGIDDKLLTQKIEHPIQIELHKIPLSPGGGKKAYYTDDSIPEQEKGRFYMCMRRV